MPQSIRSPERATAVLLTVVFFALGLGHGWSPVASFDSVRYANVGHWIGEGRGITSSVTVVPVQEGTADRGEGLHAFSIQPPGLPLLYALTGVERRTELHRVVNVASLVLLGWLVWRLGRRWLDEESAALAAVLTAASPVVLVTAANMWTDLPFTVLMFGSVACVVRAQGGRRSLVWLAGGAILAGLATGLRYPGLGLGLVFVVDALLAWRRAGARTAAIRLAVSLGVFGLFVVPLLGRNLAVAGSWTGTAPRDWPQAPGPDPLRAWSFLGSRMLQVFAPGFFARDANEFLVLANRAPAGWWLPRVLGPLLMAAGAVRVFRTRRTGGGFRLAEGVAVLVAAVLGYLVVVFAGLVRHDEVHVAEFRYLAPVAPALFLGVAALVARIPRRALARGMAMALGVMFLAGAVVLPRPAAGDHGFLRDGLNWIEANVPVEAAILTNGGKVLLEEDLGRRVYHLSVWHHRHLLPTEYRSDEGLQRFLAERDIRYVVLIGQPDRRRVQYWGRLVTSLLTGQVWTDRLMYRDANMFVFRVPETLPPARGESP